MSIKLVASTCEFYDRYSSETREINSLSDLIGWIKEYKQEPVDEIEAFKNEKLIATWTREVEGHYCPFQQENVIDGEGWEFKRYE